MRASSAEPLGQFVVLRGLRLADVECAHDQRADDRLQLGHAEGIARHPVVARGWLARIQWASSRRKAEWDIWTEIGLGDEARHRVSPLLRDIDQPRSPRRMPPRAAAARPRVDRNVVECLTAGVPVGDRRELLLELGVAGRLSR